MNLWKVSLCSSLWSKCWRLLSPRNTLVFSLLRWLIKFRMRALIVSVVRRNMVIKRDCSINSLWQFTDDFRHPKLHFLDGKVLTNTIVHLVEKALYIICSTCPWVFKWFLTYSALLSLLFSASNIGKKSYQGPPENPNTILKSLEGRTDKSNMHIKIVTKEIAPVHF